MLAHAKNDEKDTKVSPNISKSKIRRKKFQKKQCKETVNSGMNTLPMSHAKNLKKDTKLSANIDKDVEPSTSKSKSQGRKCLSRTLCSEIIDVEESSNQRPVENNSMNTCRKNMSGNWPTFKDFVLYLDKVIESEKEDNQTSPAIPLCKYPILSTESNCCTSSLKLFPYTRNKKRANLSKRLTNLVAMDCEMVGVDNSKDSILARVSLVNKYGNCVYDKFVKPREHVVDYRTHVSGIRPEDLKNGENFETVQKEVAHILEGRILIGHGLSNDLKVLFLSHPRKCIRDTSKYQPFWKISNGRTPGLKKLAAELLGVTIQEAEHDSVVDAKTAMNLYLMYKREWEFKLKYKKSKKKVTAS